ncbi:MAG: hypothetical protein ACREAD_06345 [Nitrosopumilaceae archaeon]
MTISCMRIYLIIPVIILLATSFGSSFAFTPAPSSDPSLPQISLILIVRDSNGNLVNYLEPSVIYIRNLSAVHDFINSSNYTTITKDGQTMKVYVDHRWESFDHKGQYTQYALWYQNDSVLVLNNNGYIGEPGDTLDVYWKILSR